MRNSFECDKSITGSINFMVAFYQYFAVFFFKNDITTMSYVILCSETYEIPCFEKKKSHERPQVSSEISA